MDIFWFLVRDNVVFLLHLAIVFTFMISMRHVFGYERSAYGPELVRFCHLVLLINFGLYVMEAQVSMQGTEFMSLPLFLLSGESTVSLKLLAIALTLVILVMLQEYNSRDGQGPFYELSVLFLAVLFGFLSMVESGNLFSMVMFLEIFSYGFYALPAVFRFSSLSVEAIVKYFLLGAFSSSMLLFGVALIYGSLGTTDMASIYGFLTAGAGGFGLYGDYSLLGFVFIFSALFFKLGLFPFHYWIRDVYEGSPLPVVLFLSTVGKLPALLLIARMLVVLMQSDYFYFFSLLVQFLGCLSIAFGTFWAVYQTRIKSFLAVAGLVNFGYITISLAIPNSLTYLTVLLYILYYFLALIIVLGVLMILHHRVGGLTKLTDTAIIFRYNGALALLFVVALLSLGGLPPLPGFYPKLLVFFGCISNGFYLTSVFIAFSSVANFILYVRLVRFVYFFPIDIVELLRHEAYAKPAGFPILCILSCCFWFLITSIFFLPWFLVWFLL